MGHRVVTGHSNHVDGAEIRPEPLPGCRVAGVEPALEADLDDAVRLRTWRTTVDAEGRSSAIGFHRTPMPASTAAWIRCAWVSVDDAMTTASTPPSVFRRTDRLRAELLSHVQRPGGVDIADDEGLHCPMSADDPRMVTTDSTGADDPDSHLPPDFVERSTQSEDVL